jgi:competence protein ComFC
MSPQERQNALQDAISLACPVDLSDHKVILLDDLYRSGATLTACHAVLTRRAGAGSVSVKTLTKTRVNK